MREFGVALLVLGLGLYLFGIYLSHRKRREGRAEFERRYAANSGITVAQLRELGMYAVRCDCGEPDCLGWDMRSNGSI